MYKCTECGTEFEVKPQYCDCGNDTFEEIKPVAEVPKPQQTKAPKPEPVKIKPEKKPAEKKSADILSWAIFATCLMLSLIIIFFVGNPEEKIVEEIQKEQTVALNIPSIDKFWNNSTVGVKSDAVEIQEPVTVQPVQKIVQKVIPQAAKPAVQTPKQTVQKPKTQTQQQTTKPVQKTTAQTKPVQTQTTTKPAATTTTNTASKPQIPQNTLNAASNQQTVKNTTNTQQTVKPAQTTQNTTQTTQQKPQADLASQKQELTNYKVSLRNTIGRKIDFTKVVGDGDCTVSFKISSQGQLTNRSFTKQSSNITLNDAVYQAMMSTPSFTRPPALYNNETLSLSVSFKNGNFAISLQ